MLIALTGAAAYTGTRENPEPAIPSPRPPTTTTDLGEQEPPPSVPTGPSTTVTCLPGDPGRVLVEGMAAWGRFAVSGDLEVVAPWFSAHGPQWRQFESEAPGLAAEPLGDPPYTVLVDNPVVAGHDSDERVEARVTFVRTGEASQTFDWVILLRREGGDWKIWTVDDR